MIITPKNLILTIIIKNSYFTKCIYILWVLCVYMCEIYKKYMKCMYNLTGNYKMNIGIKIQHIINTPKVHMYPQKSIVYLPVTSWCFYNHYMNVVSLFSYNVIVYICIYSKNIVVFFSVSVFEFYMNGIILDDSLCYVCFSVLCLSSPCYCLYLVFSYSYCYILLYCTVFPIFC